MKEVNVQHPPDMRKLSDEEYVDLSKKFNAVHGTERISEITDEELHHLMGGPSDGAAKDAFYVYCDREVAAGRPHPVELAGDDAPRPERCTPLSFLCNPPDIAVESERDAPPERCPIWDERFLITWVGDKGPVLIAPDRWIHGHRAYGTMNEALAARETLAAFGHPSIKNIRIWQAIDKDPEEDGATESNPPEALPPLPF